MHACWILLCMSLKYFLLCILNFLKVSVSERSPRAGLKVVCPDLWVDGYVTNSNSGVNFGEGPTFNFPKIELKKFDGTRVFTWVNQMEQYFELHNIMYDKKRIQITTLNFEIKSYQWYQWIVKRQHPLYHYTWGLFTRDLEAQYGEVWEHDYFNQLTRIEHLGDIEDYNS
jgi:hypothetical protein